MLTDKQKAERINGIGGSDIPVIAGLLEKYDRTRDELLRVKAGLSEPDEPTEEKVYWGEVLEAPIIKRLKTVKGWSIKKSDTLYHPEHRILRCNPDGIIRKSAGRKGPGMLEVKNSRFVGKAGPADYQVAQIVWNIGVSGLSWGALAILVGGCELQVFEYDADPDLFQNFVTLALEFWKDVETLKALKEAV